ncbi:hypothetical protein GGD81_001128 [Rhodobium orientis]|uniref:Uncharacterized protein n=1 Tax=Rhodobium orientis TaxID=34017 RepID=A0A327JHY7_9HYPH|nr:hypothetical protein [Rhodobium orientis]MBB4302104.1 hypothetical protein [Rhodobium orientis]MBK5951306.1 hypothetical protein [Rhodobium orientis]RAI25899.1 hypothetical protein CH339_16315 [Rhodobium orientis]
MNRRQFLLGLNRLGSGRAAAPEAMRIAAPVDAARDALFRAAMAAGLDPATIDPAQLETLLGEEERESS